MHASTTVPPPPPVDDSTDTTTTATPSEPDGAAQPRRRWLLPATIGVVVVSCLALGSLATVLVTDPTDSEEYTALTAELDSAYSDLADSEARAESAESTIATVEAAAQERVDEAAAAATANEERTAELDERESALDERSVALDEREEKIAGAEARVAETTIAEGTWTVGVDVEPGTYRTTEAISGRCYWAIYRSGSNGGDIINNANVSGGFPTVTLREGQDFRTSRCGSWHQQ